MYVCDAAKFHRAMLLCGFESGLRVNEDSNDVYGCVEGLEVYRFLADFSIGMIMSLFYMELDCIVE